MIYFLELEDKLLRIWIKYLIDRLNTNDRSSNESKTNIQRIAKKGRTSSSTTSIHGKHRNTAPLPVYPFIFHPFFHPTIYSSYMPLPYGATTHLIPISHVPYSQEAYHHRIFVPIHTPHSYEYPRPSSTPININTSIKKPVNVLTYIPPNNQNEIQKYDKTENVPLDSMIHISTHNQSIPIKETNTEEGESEESNAPRRGKPLINKKDSITNLPTTNEMNKFQQAQLPTTLVELNNSPTQINTITIPKNHYTTFIPVESSSKPNVEIVSQLPLFNDQHESDKSSTTMRIFSQSSSPEVTYFSSTTETTVETESTNTLDIDVRDGLTEERNRSGEPQKNKFDQLSLKNNDTSVEISKGSVNIEEKSAETIKPEYPEELSSTPLIPLYSKTTFISSTVCEDSDCTKSKLSPIVSPNIETTTLKSLDDSTIQMRSDISTVSPTRYYTVNDHQPSSSISLVSASTVLETTTILHKNPEISTHVTPLPSPPLTTYIDSSKTPYYKNSDDLNNENHSTSSHHTSPLFTEQPLNNDDDNTTTKLAETKTERAQTVTKTENSSVKITKQNTNTLQLLETMMTTMMTPLRHDAIKVKPSKKTSNNNKPSENVTVTKSNLSHFPTTPEKMKKNKENEMSQTYPTTTKETKISSFRSITTPIKPRSSIQKNTQAFTAAGDSKPRKSMINQDRYMNKTEPSQMLDESELWYDNQMKTPKLPKKELNEEQIDFLLKKLVKLLKPEIEKQTFTKESIERFITPKLGDQDKLVYIIFPWVRDVAKNIEKEESTEMNINK